MADQTFMFMIVAGTMIGLEVLLFVSKGLRVKSARSIENELPSTSAPLFLHVHRITIKKITITKVGKLKNILPTESQFMKTKEKKDKQR